MPDCSCGQPAYLSAKGEPWWYCDNDDCQVMAFIDEEADAVEDPRRAQQTLVEGDT